MDIQKTPTTDSLAQPICYASPNDWRAEAKRRFGENEMDWKFVCPSCGHIASVSDWLAAGATEGEVAFSCVGRHIEGSQQMCKRPGPCNYAGGGLIRLNPVKIITGPEKSTSVFAFA